MAGCPSTSRIWLASTAMGRASAESCGVGSATLVHRSAFSHIGLGVQNQPIRLVIEAPSRLGEAHGFRKPLRVAIQACPGLKIRALGLESASLCMTLERSDRGSFLTLPDQRETLGS